MKNKILIIASIILCFAFFFSCDFVSASSYNDCILASGGRGNIESVQWACEQYDPWDSNQACTLWIGGSSSQGTTIKVNSYSGTETIYYWGMCTAGTNTTSDIWVDYDNGSIDDSSNLARGAWGSPTSKATTLDIGKFISGLTGTETSEGISYHRSISVCRQHGGNDSTSCQNASLYVVIADPISYFEGYSKATFSSTTIDTGWRSSDKTVSKTIACTNQYGKCSINFEHGARRISGRSEGSWYIDRSNNSSWGVGTNSASGTFGTIPMSVARSADITVGSTICDRNKFSTATRAFSGEQSSARTQACIYAPYNFKNSASVEVPDIVYAGETMSMKIAAEVEDIYNSELDQTFHTVGNANIKWYVTVDGRAYSETYTKNLTNYISSNEEKTINVPDVLAGSEVCVVATVSPVSSNDSGAATVSDCAIVAKKPTFQTLGGGVYSSGEINTLLMNKHNLAEESYSLDGGTKKVFGSWGELAVVSNGNINNFASGATLSNGGILGDSVCNYSVLTFANANCKLGKVGVLKNNTLADNLLKTAKESEKIEIVESSEITNDIINDSYDRMISIDGLTQKIIYSTGDLNIHCNVERIDAILIAKGTINTCSNISDTNAEDRSVQLVINGDIIAQKLVLGRTYGAATGVNSTVPAEIINKNTGFYLWGIREGESSDELYTSYVREVAPRY